MLAQLWQGCVCGTGALRQNCATSPSKCIFLVTSVDMLNLAAIHLCVMRLNFSWLFPCATAAPFWKAWSHLSRTGLRNGRRRLISWTKTMPKVSKAQSLAINICCQHGTTGINWYFWGFYCFSFLFSEQNISGLARKSKGSHWTPWSSRKKQEKVRKLIWNTAEFWWLTGWWFGLNRRPLEDCIRNHSPIKSKWLVSLKRLLSSFEYLPASFV